MKKLFTLIILAAAACFAVPADAQVKFGLKGGLNITDMSFSSDVFDVSNRTGFFIGPTLKFKVPILGFGIDASALYDQREAKVKANGKNIKQQAINIPECRRQTRDHRRQRVRVEDEDIQLQRQSRLRPLAA